MSQGYYDRKRKQHITIFIIAASVILLAIVGALVLRMLNNGNDADFGKIENVENDQSQIIEETEATESIPIHVVVVNVGDAEAVLVDYGQTEILYDCGYAKNGEKVVKTIRKYVNGPLDYLILSHSHADHVGGAPEVLENFNVGTIITSGETKGDSTEFDAAMEAVKKEGCQVVEDGNLTFDIGEDATLNIIETFDPGQQEEENPNNCSVIAYITRGDDSILITGDAEADAERMLKGKIKDVSVFIAGHHMSSTSNNTLLLAEWNPDYIIASCAGPEKSEYGFPHAKALERCRLVTDNVYATYKSGDIIVTLDEKEGASINCDEDEKL